jgi:hypothetical protein
MSDGSMEVVVSPVDGQQWSDGEPFPLVYECRTAAADLKSVEEWIHESRSLLDGKALSHGTVLFRGFPLSTD